MTEKEAIKWIKKHHDTEMDNCKNSEAMRIAIECIKKQVPMIPLGEHYAHMRCPACYHRIPSGGGSSSKRRDNWCNYCGQKIDWSKERSKEK